jgi:hypothetical protein
MRIAIIQKDPLPDLRAMSLAAAAIFRGHRGRVFIPGAERNLVKAIREYSPACLIFNVCTGFEDWALGQARALRAITGHIPVFFVGQHADDFPEIVADPAVDLVLRGDAEETIPDLLFLIERDRPLQEVPGTVAWEDGALKTYPPREAIDLDTWPQHDLEIYRRYNFVRAMRTLSTTLGRGTLENLHAGFRMTRAELGRRFAGAPKRSVEDGIRALHLSVSRRKFYRRVAFRDDTFTLDPAWLTALMTRYREEIGRPFSCVSRVDLLTDEVLDALVLGGCDMVKLGIESGNPQLREQVIGKPVSDADVTAAVEALKQRGIGVQTVAFLGLPGETPETAAKTLAMSVALRPSHAHALLMADEGGSVLPECEALWRLLPVAARFPFLESRVRDAASKPREALYERVFQWNHDLGFLASGEVGPLDIARMALGMRGHS